MKTIAIIFALLALLVFSSENARAERSELRLSLGGDFDYARTQVFDGEGENFLLGVSGTAAYGLFDWLEVGGRFAALPAKSVSIDEAIVDEEGGTPGFVAFTTLSVFQLTAGARAYLDVKPFYRLRPFAGAYAGLQVSRFSEPELFFSDALVATGEADWNAMFVSTFELGLAYRLSDRFESAIVANTSVSNAMTTYGIGLEFSWMR